MSWLTDIFDTIGSYIGTYTPAPSQPSPPTPPTVYMPVAPRPSQPSTPAPSTPTYTPPPMTVVPRGSGTAPISRTPINVAPAPTYTAPQVNISTPISYSGGGQASTYSMPTVVQPRVTQVSYTPSVAPAPRPVQQQVYTPLAPREVTPYTPPKIDPTTVKRDDWWKDPSSNQAIVNMGMTGSGQQGTYAPVNPRPLDQLPDWGVTPGPQVPSWFSAPDTFPGKVERELYSAVQAGAKDGAVDYLKNQTVGGQTIQGIPRTAQSWVEWWNNPSVGGFTKAAGETVGTALGLKMAAENYGLGSLVPSAVLPVLNAPTAAIKESTGALQEGQDIYTNDYGARWKMAQEAKAAGKSREEVDKILFGDNRDLNSYAQETASLLGQDYAKKYRESSRVNILGMDFDIGDAAKYVPERDNPVNWAVKETRDMAFSGNNALRVQAQNRILAGEDPAVAIDGAAAPGPNATMDQQQLWQTRVNEFIAARGRLARVNGIKAGWTPAQVSQAEQDARVEAQQLINNTGIIPGSKDVITDMVGEIGAGFVAGATGLDPFPKLGQKFLRATKLDRFVPKTAAEKRADWLDEIYVPEMEKKVAADVQGLPEKVYKEGERAAATVADPNTGPVDKAFAKMYLAYTELAGRTERAQAGQQAQSAIDFVSRLTKGADSPWTVIQRFTGMIQDPHEVMRDAPELGNIPISVRAEMAKPVMTSDYVLKELPNLESLNQPEFNHARFMVEFQDLAQRAAARINGVGEKPPTTVEKIVGAQKAVMGEMYLRNPGYVFKQVMSDYATMAADGVVSFDSRAQINDFFDRMGVSKPEISNELNALGEPQGRESLLNKIPVVGKALGGLSDKVGDIAAQWDFDRRVRAQYAGTKKYLEENWKPILTPEVRQILGDNVADAFEANLRGALSTKELREVARRHYDPKGAGDSFSATQWMQKAGIPLDSISPQMLVQMENGARELANRGATPEETKAFFDKWRGEIDKHWRKNVASMGDVVNPRQTTENVARSDIDEVQHGATQLVKDLVEVGGMKPDEAVKRIDEVMTPLVKGEEVIRKGRESLAEKLSGIVDKPDVDVNKAASLLNWAMNKEYELRGDYRQQQAELYRKARTELDNNRRGPTAEEAWAGQVWREYFDNNRRNATKMHDDVANAYHWTAGAVDNFLAGADWNTLSKEQPDLMSIESYAQKLIDSTRAQMDAQGADGFSKMLASDRVKGDQARQELFRRAVVTMRADPSISTDLFDVLMTSEKDVRMNAAKAATEAEIVRDQMVTQGMDMRDYYTRIGEIWKNHFDFAEQRNAIAMTQLAYTQARNSEMGRMLQGLGYNDKAIAQMFARMDTAEGKAAVQKELGIRQQRLAAMAAEQQARAVKSQSSGPLDAVSPQSQKSDTSGSPSPLDNPPSSPARDRVETYLREQFKDLPDQQMKAAMAVMDARAEIWARQNNTTPDGWYSSRLATTFEPSYDAVDVLNQGPKGAVEFLDDGRAVIKALESPDISTLMHEVGHVFRRDLQGEDLGIASEWAGAKKLDNGEWQWNREAEEKFARGFEKYLSDGEAPNVGLRRVFDQFKTWLTTIYSKLRGVLPDTISDQIRGVYDRLLAERVDQMKPPVTAEEFARMRAAPDMSPDTMRTLLSEAQRQQERVRGETDFGKMDELKAAAAQLPDAVEVNRWLQPNGEPRLSIMSNGQRYEFPNGWVDAQGGGLDKLIAEANQKYAIDGNVTGGDAQAWFDKLTEAKRVRSEMKAMLADGKRQYEKTAKSAGDAMTGWQNIIDDLQQRLGQNKVDEAGKAAQEALSQANGDVDSAIETLTNKYQGDPEKFAAVLDALQAEQQKGRPLNQGEPAPQPKQPIDNLVEAVQKLVDTLQPKPEPPPAQPAPPPEPSPREKIRQIITAAAQGKLSADQARTEINKLEPTLRDMTRTEEMALNSIGKQLQGGQPSYIQPTARINGEQIDTGHIMQRLGAEQVGPGTWQKPGMRQETAPREAQANPFPWEREAPQPVTEQDKATLLTLSPKQDAELKALYKRAMAKAKGQQPIVELPDVRENNLMTWFKGSEVVNGDGTPRQVYHFTNATFDTFDSSKLGGATKHPNTNLGFFFGDSPEISSLFASTLPEGVDRQTIYKQAVEIYNKRYGTKGKPNLDSGEAQSNFYEAWMQARHNYKVDYREGGAAMPVYLSMKNPYVMPWSDWHKLNGMVYGDAAKADAIAKDFRTKLEGMGYDGIVLPKKQKSDNPEWLQDTYIVFKPEQIKSAIGNKGTFDPNNPNILYQEQPKVKADQTESPEFKKWFGESKITDEQGTPLRVYHGTGKSFEQFNTRGNADATGNVTAVWGSFFSPSPGEASRYSTDFAKEGSNVVPTYLSIKNPYEMTRREWDQHAMVVYKKEKTQEQAITDERAFRDDLIKQGYDGIVVKGRGFNAEYVAFYPEQIKSAIANRGTFDPNNPNILLQNQPEMAGTDFAKKNGLFSRPGEADPETLARYQDRAVENGAVENVAHMLDINDAVHGAGKKAIDAIEKGFADHVANWQPGEKVYSGQERGMMQKELLRLTQQHSEIFSKAREYGKQLQNSSLLDYSDKRGIDTYIQLVAPFAYWGTRQGRNYALRAMANPNLVATYWRYQQAVEAENKKKNVRGRFGASLQVPGTNLYVDPTPWLFPFSDFMGRDSMADAGEAKSAAQKAYDLAGMVGIRPGPLLDIPLRYSNLLVNKSPGEQGYGAQEAEYGRGSIGELLPLNGIIQTATAAFGIGGPTGFDAEGRLRKMLGMHEAETWEPYVISRSISDMAAQANRNGGPMDTRAYLIAQRFVDDNQSNIPTALRESTAQQLSDKYHIDPQMAQQALDIARRGALQATLQKGTQQMSSFFTGLRVKQLPPGEQARWQMKQYEKGAAYNPYTDTVSRKQLQQVQDFFPALQVQRAQYGAVPGDEKNYNYLYVIEEKKRLNAKFDADLGNIIRERPWDRDASKEIDSMRFNTLRQLDEMQGTKAPDETKPSSIYGANKAEALQIRQNDILRLVSKQAPKVENFESYDQYKSERDAYRSNVASIAAGNPQTGAILQLADKEGNGDALRQFIGGLTYNQVSTYKGRYDLPLEAAQNAYFDLVYEPAILDYNRQLVRGDPRQAWENTIGRVGATDANALASLIKQQYGGRWTDDELAQGLQGMNMPILAEMIKRKYEVAADGGFKYRQDYLYGANNIDPQTEFWRWYRNEIPPGRAANGLRDIPQVSMALDPAAAAKMTPAQWESALNLGRAWMASEFGDVPPDARVEWAQAKDESKQLNTLLMKEYGPEGQKLLDMYFNAPDAKTKAAMRKAIPMLDSILSMRQTYAEKKAIYDAYYGPGSYGNKKNAQGHYSSGGSGKGGSGGSGGRGRARYSRGGRYRGRSSSRSYTPSFNYGYTRGYTGYVVKPMNPSSGLGPIQPPKLTPRKVKMNPLKG